RDLETGPAGYVDVMPGVIIISHTAAVARDRNAVSKGRKASSARERESTIYGDAASVTEAKRIGPQLRPGAIAVDVDGPCAGAAVVAHHDQVGQAILVKVGATGHRDGVHARYAIPGRA